MWNSYTRGDGSFSGFCVVLFKRDTRKDRGIAMGDDAVGSDLEMYE